MRFPDLQRLELPRFLDNPELIRHVRARVTLLPTLVWVSVYVLALGLGMIGVGGLVLANRRAAGLEQAARAAFQWILFLNWFLLTIVGAGRISGAVAAEIAGLTQDAQRLAPIHPIAFPLGKLFGVPIRGYLYVLASLPPAAICFLLGGVTLTAMAQCYVLLLGSTVFYHALALLRVRAPKPNEVTGVGSIVALLLSQIGFAIPLTSDFSLLALPSVAPLLWALSKTGACTVWILGTEVPAAPLALPLYLGGAWLLASMSARALRTPSRPEITKPAALLCFGCAVSVALILCAPAGTLAVPLSYPTSERMRVGGLALALLCAGLAFACATAVGALDLRTCLRAAMRQGRAASRFDDRNDALPLLAAVAAIATVAIAGRCRLWAMDDASIADAVHKTACAALAGLAIFGQGSLIYWGRLFSERSGRALVAGLLLFVQVTGALAGNLLSSLRIPGGTLLSMLCPPVFFFSQSPAPTADGTFQVVRALGFVVPQVLCIALGVALNRRARAALAEQARNTLMRTGMLPRKE